jgi:hypothetical protein
MVTLKMDERINTEKTIRIIYYKRSDKSNFLINSIEIMGM